MAAGTRTTAAKGLARGGPRPPRPPGLAPPCSSSSATRPAWRCRSAIRSGGSELKRDSGPRAIAALCVANPHERVNGIAARVIEDECGGMWILRLLLLASLLLSLEEGGFLDP